MQQPSSLQPFWHREPFYWKVWWVHWECRRLRGGELGGAAQVSFLLTHCGMVQEETGGPLSFGGASLAVQCVTVWGSMAGVRNHCSKQLRNLVKTNFLFVLIKFILPSSRVILVVDSHLLVVEEGRILPFLIRPSCWSHSRKPFLCGLLCFVVLPQCCPSISSVFLSEVMSSILHVMTPLGFKGIFQFCIPGET